MPRFFTYGLVYFLILGIFVGIGTISANGAHGFGNPCKDDDDTVKTDDIEKWGASKLVFVGTLTRVVAGPVGRSFPPVYTHKLEFEILEVLRGEDSDNGITAGESLTCSNVARQHEEPTFPEGEKCLVAADLSRGTWKIVRIEELTDENLGGAKLALQVPFGWRVKDGALVSPWASLGEKAWPKGQDMNVTLLCNVTGRPALMAGAAAVLTVEPVPPEKEIKWTNPDGDGLYTVTVSNPTDQPIEIPALLSKQGEILWADSLVILCQAKTYIVPGTKSVSGKVESTFLKPGEKVSTVINALTLDGPNWPRGGMRVEFQFCLGEKSNIQSFYYMSRHHDAIRKKAKPAKPKKRKPKKQSNNTTDWSDKIAFESKRNSTVDVRTNEGKFELAVHSPTGIDTLTILRKQDSWPDSITVRLHTKGLESIRISNAVGTISGEFPSTAGRAPIIEFAVQGKPAQSIDSNSSHWPDLSLVSPGKKIPVEQGYFKFEIPLTLLTPESDTVTVAWIDFYRG